MASIPTTEDPTPARGLRDDMAQLNPERFEFRKSGAVAVATAIDRRIYNHSGRTLELMKVYADVGTAPTGADMLLDVNVGHAEDAAVTAFSAQTTRPKIVAAAKNAVPATPAQAGNPVLLPDGDYLTVDVDQVGSGVAGSDLTVVVTARPAHPAP